jgi:hypothetical protein
MAAARLAEEEEMAQRIEQRVRERVEAAMKSEEVQKQIELRLREERAALEQKVCRITLAVLLPCAQGVCNSDATQCWTFR